MDSQKLFTELTLTVGEKRLRDEFMSLLYLALNEYERARIAGTDLFAMMGMRRRILGALWWWKAHLTNSQQATAFERIARIFSDAVTSVPDQPSRTEFAFLTGWKHALEWTDGVAVPPIGLRRIAEDILDLLTALEADEVIPTFLGMGRGKTRWERVTAYDDLRSDLMISKEVFAFEIAPYSSELHSDLLAFVGIWIK